MPASTKAAAASSTLATLNRDIQDSITSAIDPRICFFCAKKRLGKYQCPRCSRHYCSLDCYSSKAHSACFSSFKRDLETAKTSTTQTKESDDGVITNGEEKIRLRQLVNEYELDAEENPLGDFAKFANKEKLSTLVDSDIDDDSENAELENESKDDDDDDEYEIRRRDLENRMRDVDIESADFDALWSRLTVSEQADFLRLAKQHENDSNQKLLE
ncbi:uncharacterized protein V2V93DRAFT_364713 [Kockiozyma suomiensis]|uniref:uncharacterized protein n=1 Tax=Kockiozyma suomiensis TaxID=1337062 RepID=UPI003343970F